MSKMIASKLRCAHLTPENIIEEADKPLKDEANKYKEKNEVHLVVIIDIPVLRSVSLMLLKAPIHNLTLSPINC